MRAGQGGVEVSVLRMMIRSTMIRQGALPLGPPPAHTEAHARACYRACVKPVRACGQVGERAWVHVRVYGRVRVSMRLTGRVSVRASVRVSVGASVRASSCGRV